MWRMLKKYAWMYVCEKSTNLELQFELVFHALVVVPTCPFPKRPSRIRFDRKPIIIIGFIVLYVLDKRLIFGFQTFRPLGRSRTCISIVVFNYSFILQSVVYVPAFKDRRGIFWSAAFVLESIPLFFAVFFVDMILLQNNLCGRNFRFSDETVIIFEAWH